MSADLLGFVAAVVLLVLDLWVFWREMTDHGTTKGPETLPEGEPGALADGSTSIRGSYGFRNAAGFAESRSTGPVTPGQCPLPVVCQIVQSVHGGGTTGARR